jgi:nicotinate-nucleotide adenylyltransferase
VSKGERIGVFGGTFDPIHSIHIEIARTALEYAELDRVIFMVAANPPHKTGEVSADGEDRFRMVRLAIASEPAMEASRMEIDREGPSYTVDTLRELRRHHPDGEFFFIIGEDSLEDFLQWRDPEGIVSLARLLVAPRPDTHPDPPPELAAHVEFIPFPEQAVSSSEIRERLQAGRDVGDLAPPEVRDYIRENDLYDGSG